MWWGVTWADAVIAIATGFLAIGVFLAIVGYFVSWRSVFEAVKSRHTQVFMDISRRWDSEEMLKTRAEIYEMTAGEFRDYYRNLELPNGTESTTESRLASLRADLLANFFEDLALLEARGSLDIRWIEESLGSVVFLYWKRWELVAVEDRSDEEDLSPDKDLLYKNWEALASRIETRMSQRQYHHPKKRLHHRKHF